MSWTPVLLALLVHCIGCGSQPVLNQPPSMSSSLGTTIHLPCTLSRDHDVSIYNIYWYQQRPGHPPRFVLRYFSRSDNNQGFKIPPRFSGSKDVAKNTGYLSIAELQPEDEATYYCAVGAQGMEKAQMLLVARDARVIATKSQTEMQVLREYRQVPDSIYYNLQRLNEVRPRRGTGFRMFYPLMIQFDLDFSSADVRSVPQSRTSGHR
ncbi:immunoglobulin iota chain-like [Neomonachus schauinslandi]|uniref:immunoglobulin iota chain-like n=1 Tax=Neomonachus schauinslandi TaxID=29088 RepID=UPI000B510024|nr:immunoglobulin iota chain-like [Neomonachus schauinslandi]